MSIRAAAATNRRRLRVAAIGAGSAIWTLRLAQSLLATDLDPGTLVLMDINEARLDFVARLIRKFFHDHRAGWQVVRTRSLDKALAGADYIVVTVSLGGDAAHKRDITTAARYGALSTIGDTYGVAGISRSLRHVPFIVNLARRMQELCPDAWLFNYTNPLTALTQAVSKETSIKAAGFCHGVANAIATLGPLLGYTSHQEASFQVLGVDHCSWLLALRHRGRDLYPEIRRLSTLSHRERLSRCHTEDARRRVRNHRRCFDLCRDIGYFPTIAENHIVEFFHPFLTAKSDLVRYGYTGGQTQADIRAARAKQVCAQYEAILAGKGVYPPPGNDLLARPIAALEGGEPLVDVLNYKNTGQAPGFPHGAVVETVCLMDGAGIHPVACGPLPATVRSLIAQALHYQALIIEAAMENDAKKVMAALLTAPHAVHYDRLSALADELLRINRPYRA